MSYAIRPRTADDLASTGEALLETHAADQYPRHFPADPIAWLQPPRQRLAWVAVADLAPDHREIVVGHAALNVAEGDPALAIATAWTGLPAERLAVVARLFVRPGWRRQGIAASLLNTVAAAAHAEQKRPTLDVLEADVKAIGLYERAGWQCAGPIQFHWPPTGEPLPAFVFVGPAPGG